MKIVSTYKVKITNYTHIMDETLAIYRKALSFVLPIVDKHYDDINIFNFLNEKQRVVETLIHTTKSNMALYDFDVQFYKFPTYLRRAVISEALGMSVLIKLIITIGYPIRVMVNQGLLISLKLIQLFIKPICL